MRFLLQPAAEAAPIKAATPAPGTTTAPSPRPPGRRRRRRTAAIVIAVLALVLVAGSAYSYRPDIAASEVERRYATAESEFVSVAGVRTHYVDVGSGRPLILIHGSNSSLYDWEGWTSELSRDFRVIALDLPGHGLTGPDPAKRYRYVDQARFVDQFARTLGLRSYHVAGNSMGGSVAWHLAAMRPAQIDKLILLDSVGLPREEPRPLMFRLYDWPVVDRLLTVFTPKESVGMALRDLYGDPDRVTGAEIERTWTLLRREGNREAARIRLQQQPDSDSWVPRLRGLEEPTLIMWGAKDDWVLPKYGRRFDALIPDSRLVTYPDLGHLPMLEAPARTAADARKFLAAR